MEEVGALQNAPLAQCINVTPATTHPSNDGQATPPGTPIIVSVDTCSHLIVTCTALGCVALWTDSTGLSLLTHFNCLEGLDDDDADAMDDVDDDFESTASKHEDIVSVHSITDGQPLSNVFVLTTLYRASCGESRVRVHALNKQLDMFADQMREAEAGTMLRCIFCPNSFGGNVFPDRACLSAHLARYHQNTMSFSSNQILDEPVVLGDVCVPLARVCATQVLRKNPDECINAEGVVPTHFAAVGLTSGGVLSLATASLEPLLCQTHASQLSFPSLQWTVVPIAGVPSVPISSQLITVSFHELDDALAGFAQDGSFFFMCWRDGTSWVCSHVSPGDSVVAVAWTLEHRKLAVLQASSRITLVDPAPSAPVRAVPDFSNVADLAVLKASRVFYLLPKLS